MHWRLAVGAFRRGRFSGYQSHRMMNEGPLRQHGFGGHDMILSPFLASPHTLCPQLSMPLDAPAVPDVCSRRDSDDSGVCSSTSGIDATGDSRLPRQRAADGTASPRAPHHLGFCSSAATCSRSAWAVGEVSWRRARTSTISSVAPIKASGWMNQPKAAKAK